MQTPLIEIFSLVRLILCVIVGCCSGGIIISGRGGGSLEVDEARHQSVSNHHQQRPPATRAELTDLADKHANSVIANIDFTSGLTETRQVVQDFMMSSHHDVLETRDTTESSAEAMVPDLDRLEFFAQEQRKQTFSDDDRDDDSDDAAFRRLGIHGLSPTSMFVQVSDTEQQFGVPHSEQFLPPAADHVSTRRRYVINTAVFAGSGLVGGLVFSIGAVFCLHWRHRRLKAIRRRQNAACDNSKCAIGKNTGESVHDTSDLRSLVGV